MSTRRIRTAISLLLVLIGVGTIAFNGLQAVVDRRLSDSLEVETEVNRSAAGGTWRWIFGAGALTAGLALVGGAPRRP